MSKKVSSKVGLYELALGRTIKALRHETGIAQEIFAYKIDVNRTYMTDIELGRRSVGIGVVRKIALGFGMTVTELMAHVDNTYNVMAQSWIDTGSVINDL